MGSSLFLGVLILVVLLLFVLMTPYYLTRMVLQVTLACFRDKTSPEAASGVRVAAAVTFGLGLLVWGFVSSVYWDSGGWWAAAFWVLPLFCHWAALATPLKVKAPEPATEPGFSKF